MDREKVIKEFEHLLNAAKGNYQDFVDLTVDGGEEILALLKEQETEISRVSNEYLALVGKASKKPTVVRCKDCKFMYEDDVFQCAIKDGYFPVHEEWFCADGEHR